MRVYAEDSQELGSCELQVIIGEFVHNLRSALNYIAYGVWRHDSPKEKIPDKFQFPIESCEKNFSNKRSTLLKGISDKHVALLKQFQPCKGCDWMKLLVDLSNKDKHRELVSIDVDFFIRMETFETDESSSGDEDAMHMYRVRDQEITIGNRGPVVQVLKEIHAEVTNVLEEFNTSLLNEFKAEIAAIKRSKK